MLYLAETFLDLFPDGGDHIWFHELVVDGLINILEIIFGMLNDGNENHELFRQLNNLGSSFV